MRKSLFLFLLLFVATFVMAQNPATFEDVQLNSSGIWQPLEGNNEMHSGGWAFTNYYLPQNFWKNVGIPKKKIVPFGGAYLIII